MAPGQQQSPQNIQSFIQNSNISAKQSPPTSKGGQSSNLSQSYISTTPGNLQPTGVFNARGLPSTIPLAFRPAGPNGQIMMTNQMNLIPINVSPNFQYQVAPGTALGIHEIHPPPPTLSPNVAQPSSRSPKSSGEGKKKKLGKLRLRISVLISVNFLIFQMHGRDPSGYEIQMSFGLSFSL